MSKSERDLPKLTKTHVTALLIFLFALGFRVMGIGWGLKNDLHNASYHPDEPLVFGFSRAIAPEHGQFVPEAEIPNFYSYGTLYLSLLRVASDMTSTYGGAPKVSADGWSWSNPKRTDWDWVSRCHLAGRVISAIAGALTAVFAFLMLSRSVGIVAGVAAGVFIAVAPAHVVHSRFQTVDVLATCLLSVSLYYSVKIAYAAQESGDKLFSELDRLALLSGAFAGLSGGTKYTGILALFSLVAALVASHRASWMKPSLIGVAACISIFLLTTPGALMDRERFWRGITYEMAHTGTGHGLVFTGTANGFVYTMTNLLFGIGPILLMMGLVGLAYAGFRRHRWAWVLLAFGLPYYLLIGRSEVKFVRYTFPLYITVAAGFGYAVQVCHRRGGAARLGVGAAILGIGGVPFGGLATAGAMTNSMIGEDPRDQAARHLIQNKMEVGYPNTPWFWSAPLFPDSADPLSVQIPTRMTLAQAEAKVAVLVPLDAGGNISPWNRDLIDKMGAPTICFSSFEYFPIRRLQGRKDLGVQQAEVDGASAFIEELQSKFLLDQTFGNPILGGSHPELLPEDLFYTDPEVFVWKRKPS